MQPSGSMQYPPQYINAAQMHYGQPGSASVQEQIMGGQGNNSISIHNQQYQEGAQQQYQDDMDDGDMQQQDPN